MDLSNRRMWWVTAWEITWEAENSGREIHSGDQGINTEKENYKALFVVQGHLNEDKPYLVHASSNLKQDTVRMLFELASLVGLEIWGQDISQAYLQRSSEVMREVYMDPKSKEFNLKPGQILKLIKTLYSLPDSGDRWHHALKDSMVKKMKMLPTIGDLGLYFKHIGERMDDLIETGNENFKKFSKLNPENI